MVGRGRGGVNLLKNSNVEPLLVNKLMHGIPTPPLTKNRGSVKDIIFSTFTLIKCVFNAN